MIAIAGQVLTVEDVPVARALRAEASSFDAQNGTLTVALDRDGNGTLEATEKVAAELIDLSRRLARMGVGREDALRVEDQRRRGLQGQPGEGGGHYPHLFAF